MSPEDFPCTECGSQPGEMCRRAGKPPFRLTPHFPRFQAHWRAESLKATSLQADSGPCGEDSHPRNGTENVT